MDRSTHYQKGLIDGKRMAEVNRTEDGAVQRVVAQTLRDDARLFMEYRQLGLAHDKEAAYRVGIARGYRLTIPIPDLGS